MCFFLFVLLHFRLSNAPLSSALISASALPHRICTVQLGTVYVVHVVCHLQRYQVLRYQCLRYLHTKPNMPSTSVHTFHTHILYSTILYDSKHDDALTLSLSLTLLYSMAALAVMAAAATAAAAAIWRRPNIQTNLIYISVCLSEHSLMSVSEQTRQRRRCAMCTRIDTHTHANTHLYATCEHSSKGAR